MLKFMTVDIQIHVIKTLHPDMQIQVLGNSKAATDINSKCLLNQRNSLSIMIYNDTAFLLLKDTALIESPFQSPSSVRIFRTIIHFHSKALALSTPDFLVSMISSNLHSQLTHYSQISFDTTSRVLFISIVKTV